MTLRRLEFHFISLPSIQHHLYRHDDTRRNRDVMELVAADAAIESSIS